MPDLGFSQFQKISQEQVLSPQVLHALKILQVPAMELAREISDEMSKNPLLEEIPGTAHSGETLPTESDDARADDGFFEEDTGSDALKMPSEKEPEDFSEEERWDYENGSAYSGTTGTWSREDEERRTHLFDSLVERVSLPRILESQIALCDEEDVSPELLKVIAQNIDEKGFLDVSVEALADAQCVPVEDAERALRVFQTFDPPGVGARDLREAFLIQLRRLGRENALAYRILDSDYELFLARKFPAIARRYGVPAEDVRAAISEISKLKRVPAEEFSADENREISPDMTIYFDREKSLWRVRMENAYVPKLRISGFYKTLIAQGKISGKDRTYFTEKMRSGRFLINAIEQRQRTIEQIGVCIVNAQREFLERGPAYLRPLTMATVAQEIGVHETTVSRAVSNKYVETPHGVFELRSFFNAGLETDGGEELANAGVREVLREILDAESPKKPLSDQRLVAELAARGIKIARRTITKYRAIMNIPPAHLRKKF